MNKEFFLALEMLEQEKGIPVDFMLDKITKAIVTACKNNYDNDNVEIEIDANKHKFEVYLRKEIVDVVEDANCQMYVGTAKLHDRRAEVGKFAKIKLDTKQFGRVAAQTARNIIRQGIRDSERGQMLVEFKSKHQELVSGLVERIDPRSNAITLKIGKSEAVLPKSEQVGTENIKEGDHVKVYVVDVRETEKGPKAIISRTHPDFVKRLFENEVPEIFDGTVEIKAVSREAGSRTKIAVLSHNADVDAVGACIGNKGSRVAGIVDELGGEKIDIVVYNDDPTKFISAALAPANVVSVEIIDTDAKTCKVTVPDNQLSLAIGNKGQNARLAAKLTNWKIDIKPESGFFGEEGQK
ncbi:MAG: transcription termination factor NusA [Clostridia bacterium]